MLFVIWVCYLLFGMLFVQGKDSVGVGAENIFSGATTVSTDANDPGYLGNNNQHW